MQKIFYHIVLENDSPIHIGNGSNEHTDMDLIRDEKGHFFIPGTSFAGPIMHYLKNDLFQPKMNDEFKQSPAFISDFRMDAPDGKIEVRDGIRLEDKVTVDGAKYDFEIIPAGKQFTGTIEIINREDKEEYEATIEDVLNAIHAGVIRFGYKTSRGFGKMKVCRAKKQVFNEENIESFFVFDKDDETHYSSLLTLDEKPDEGIHITAVLEQAGGLSIRTYNTIKGEADFRHIHSAEKPVIPGTSWNGLIRSEFSKNKKRLGLKLNIDDLFGYVDGEKKKKSKIWIDESFIHEGYSKELTRNSIDPFYAGAKDGALFKGEYFFNGDTELRVTVPDVGQNEFNEHDYHEFMLLMMLFLKDLDMGFIALGGETSTGKGLFKVKEIKENGELIQFDDYMEVRNP